MLRRQSIYTNLSRGFTQQRIQTRKPHYKKNNNTWSRFFSFSLFPYLRLATTGGNKLLQNSIISFKFLCDIFSRKMTLLKMTVTFSFEKIFYSFSFHSNFFFINLSHDMDSCQYLLPLYASLFVLRTKRHEIHLTINLNTFLFYSQFSLTEWTKTLPFNCHVNYVICLPFKHSFVFKFFS